MKAMGTPTTPAPGHTPAPSLHTGKFLYRLFKGSLSLCLARGLSVPTSGECVED